MSEFTKGQAVTFQTSGRSGLSPVRNGTVHAVGTAGTGRIEVSHNVEPGKVTIAKPFIKHVKAA